MKSAVGLLALSLASLSAYAETFEVRMVNRGPAGAMVYEPDFLRLAPGDTVRFKATNSTHNAASMVELSPPGAQAFMGKIDEEIEVVFQQPGFHGIKCVPHYAMGMVMLVHVTAPGEQATNTLNMPASVPAKARQRLLDIAKRESL